LYGTSAYFAAHPDQAEAMRGVMRASDRARQSGHMGANCLPNVASTDEPFCGATEELLRDHPDLVAVPGLVANYHLAAPRDENISFDQIYGAPPVGTHNPNAPKLGPVDTTRSGPDA
jgi:hypothetical protein